MTIERGEVDLREVSWDTASNLLIKRGKYRKRAPLEDIKNQRDEQRISTGADSVFAVSAVLAGLRRESACLAWWRDERKGDLLRRSGGSPLLAGREL